MSCPFLCASSRRSPLLLQKKTELGHCLSPLSAAGRSAADEWDKFTIRDREGRSAGLKCERDRRPICGRAELPLPEFCFEPADPVAPRSAHESLVCWRPA
ncbi:unnamed protein product, partial [Iphiclides podalirius]